MMAPPLPAQGTPSKSDKVKNSISMLVGKWQFTPQPPIEPIASTPGLSTIPVQKRHKSPVHRTPECPSPTIDDIHVHSCTPAVSPAAGGCLLPPNGSQAGEPTASAAPPETAPSPQTNQLQDIFREPLEIPGHRKKVYIYRHADACISNEHKNRYPQIIDLFRQKLPTVKALLKARPADTLYKMKMCGPDREKAQPSILICHPWGDIAIVRQIWKSLRGKSLRAQYEDTLPAFGIYIFLSNNFWMLGNPTESLSIYMKNGLVGAQVVSNDTSYQMSTITCGISFAGGKPIFALTSAHAFEDYDKEQDKLVASQDNTIIGSGSQKSDDTSDCSVSSMDDEYDWDELEVAIVRERYETGLSQSDEPGPLRHNGMEELTRHTEIKPSRVLGRQNNPNWKILDWALVEIPNFEQSSSFGRTSDHDSVIKPASPSESEGPVLVATASGLLEGTLSSIPSYLASSRSSDAWSEIWTLTLADKDQERLHKGDSGSPVLNLEQDLLYGYITALNPFSELHVMPLPAVLDQIRETVEPSNPTSKPAIFDRVVAVNMIHNNAATSEDRWPIEGYLLQHWPKERPDVLHNRSLEVPVSPPNDVGNDPSILHADVKDEGGKAALWRAAKMGDEAEVKLLLEYGADVNALGGTFGNALQAASDRGYEQVVKPELNANANANVQLPIRTVRKYPSSWSVRVIFVPRQSQQFAYDIDSTCYRRCASRNLQQNLKFSSQHSSCFVNAVETSFKDIIRARPWMPMSGHRNPNEPFGRMSLQRLPHDLLFRDIWDYPFLENHCIAHDPMQGDVLYVALQYEDVTWKEIRFLPPTQGADESCWAYNEELDGIPKYSTLDSEIMYDYRDPSPVYITRTRSTTNTALSKPNSLADSKSIFSTVETSSLSSTSNPHGCTHINGTTIINASGPSVVGDIQQHSGCTIYLNLNVLQEDDRLRRQQVENSFEVLWSSMAATQPAHSVPPAPSGASELLFALSMVLAAVIVGMARNL